MLKIKAKSSYTKINKYSKSEIKTYWKELHTKVDSYSVVILVCYVYGIYDKPNKLLWDLLLRSFSCDITEVPTIDEIYKKVKFIASL